MVPRPGIATRGATAGIRQRVPELLQTPESKKPRTFLFRASMMVPRPGIATRGATAGIRQRVPELLQTPESKKPSHFCKGFNDGASTRDRTRDTRIFNPLLYQLSYRGETRLRYKRFPPVLLWVRIKRISA
jgi:hypothetical protein